MSTKYAMIDSLHKRDHTDPIDFESNEGERTLLCNNKGGMRFPSLDLGITPDATEDELIGILADILMRAFLWQHNHDIEQSNQGGHLLPGIDKGTG